MEKRELPLVSILIPNFNHSRYLEQCIESAINQTYENIEVVVLDNNSTDASIECIKKYVGQKVRINKNQCNIMNNTYRVLANELCNGKYFILLCADDCLQPGFIEQAVAILEKYPNVGYVQGERDYITKDNEILSLDPFYSCSFIAPGRNAMPIYMMTEVAIASQTVIRKIAFDRVGGYDMEVEHLNADRSMWFYLSYEYDVAYIREKSSYIRKGDINETYRSLGSFQHPILMHLIIKEFVYFAKNNELLNVYEREEEALLRLARQFISYVAELLYRDEFVIAKKYLLYAKIVSRAIEKDGIYQKFLKMVETGEYDKIFIENQVTIAYEHKRSYVPPAGYQEMNPEEVRQWMKQNYK